MALLLWYIFIFKIVSASEPYNNGILHHINTGMNFAKDILGSESVALKVADFVVRAFQPTISEKQRPTNNFHESSESEEKYASNQDYDMKKQSIPLSPWRHLVRLLGLQPNQISAVAVNALIFVAQMITTFLAGPKNSNKTYRSDDPVKWMLEKNSKRLQKVIAAAKNDSLAELITEIIQEQEPQEETSCIKLLVCKITPFIKRMQEAVFSDKSQENNANVRGANIFYRHLPTKEEINSKSEVCEKQFKDCDLSE